MFHYLNELAFILTLVYLEKFLSSQWFFHFHLIDHMIGYITNINNLLNVIYLWLQVIVTRSVLLWVGARGSEFDWRYVRSCAESNVALLQHAATAALVWLWTRSDLPRKHTPIVITLLALSPYRMLLEDAVASILSLSAWSLLALRALHASAVGLTALAMYAVLAQQIGI